MSGAEGAAGDTTGSRRSFIARQFPPFTPRQWRVFAIAFTAGFFDNYDDALLSLALKQIQRGLERRRGQSRHDAVGDQAGLRRLAADHTDG